MAEDAVLAVDLRSGAVPIAAEEDELERKLEKRRAKVRSAWIAFVGRIVAQIMGAVATISLGLMVVQKYHTPAAAPAVAPAPAESHAVRPARLVTPGEVSLAVLPLEDVSPDGENSFARGMTDALITDLVLLDGVRVVSRTSSAVQGRAGRMLPEIARELGVDYIVDGTVTRVDGRVRVAVRLVDARRDENLLAQSHIRAVRPTLSIQAELARAIARGVRTTLATASSSAAGVVSRRKPEPLHLEP